MQILSVYNPVQTKDSKYISSLLQQVADTPENSLSPHTCNLGVCVHFATSLDAKKQETLWVTLQIVKLKNSLPMYEIVFFLNKDQPLPEVLTLGLDVFLSKNTKCPISCTIKTF